MYETEGIYLSPEQQTAEAIMAQWEGIADPSGQKVLGSGAQQSEKFLKKAMAWSAEGWCRNANG